MLLTLLKGKIHRATVTDANLALGYLNPGWFYGGELELDVDAVHRAIDEQIRALQLGDAERALAGKPLNAQTADLLKQLNS
mgnify:CR=1 FL=1